MRRSQGQDRDRAIRCGIAAASQSSRFCDGVSTLADALPWEQAALRKSNQALADCGVPQAGRLIYDACDPEAHSLRARAQGGREGFGEFGNIITVWININFRENVRSTLRETAKVGQIVDCQIWYLYWFWAYIESLKKRVDMMSWLLQSAFL